MIGIRPRLYFPSSTTSILRILSTGHRMTQQRKKSSLDTEPMLDKAKIQALRQYNDTDGHFSLVRFVDDAPRDLHRTRSEITANKSWFGTGISISQTS